MTNDTLRPILKSQFHASLAMLKDAIEKCPDDVWFDDRVTNRYWQIAYHVLYYAHLYLHPDEKSVREWAGHQSQVQYPSGLTNPRLEVDKSLPRFATPYSKAQVLEFWDICDGLVDGAIDSFDLDSPECGFWWYKMGKLEHQFINIRHIQHHAAQLADRLRVSQDVGVPWVGMRH
ncbi:MAG: hypothetical protein Q7R30_04935 [Acidobacteriota bacterium]|nr:hypothetical protein [Acidobacteriota bacterium]